MDALAAHYWNKPETANCTIVIPVPRRRPTESASRITLRLHKQYLSAKSLFLRGLFSGASPIDILQSLHASRLHRSSPPPRIPHSQLPRILPSPPSHPIVFLPVPDPSSIQPLIHWMYFANTDHIQNALERGDIRWDGLARNAEYLGLSRDIKVFLGRWYRLWHLPAQSSPRCSPCPADEDEDVDVDVDSDYESESESESESEAYYSSASLPSDEDEDEDEDGMRDDNQNQCERSRGRTRDIKPLVRLCGQLRVWTT